MSARDRTPFSGEQSTRNRSPRECRIERNASSGFVSRRRFARIVRLACSDDAHDASMRVAPRGAPLSGKSSKAYSEQRCALKHQLNISPYVLHQGFNMLRVVVADLHDA